MLWTRTTGELTRSSLIGELPGTTLGTRSEIATATHRRSTARSAALIAAVEDRPPTLNSSVWPARRNSCRRRWRRCLVNGTRPGLRHDDFTRLDDRCRRSNRSSRDRSSRRVRYNFTNRRLGWRSGDGSRRDPFGGGSRNWSWSRNRGRNWRLRGNWGGRRHCDSGYRRLHPGSRRRGFDNHRRWGRRLRNFNGHGWRGCFRLRRNNPGRGRNHDHRRRSYSYGGCQRLRRRHSRNRRPDHDRSCGGCHDNGGAHRRRARKGASGGASNHWAGWRTGSNRRSRRRRLNDWRSLARLRDDPTRLWTDCGWRRCGESIRRSNHGTRSTETGGLSCILAAGSRAGPWAGSRCRRTHDNGGRSSPRSLRILRLTLSFFLAGEDSPHGIPRLGDIGEIKLGPVFLLRPLIRLRRTGAPLEMSANLLRLKRFNGTGVRLALTQIHRIQRVQNLFALHFQLTCQIVNSNLTHPPLFVVVLYSG